MGFGSWVDRKLNSSILTTCEKALFATMLRAQQNETFCRGLTEQLSRLLANLYPSLSPVTSANLFQIDEALADTHPSRLEQVATKLMDVSNKMQKEGLAEAAAAGGAVAGWLKASAMVQTGDTEIGSKARALKDEYYKWIYVLLV